MAAPGLAQDTGTFSLPSPTPTPTPAPQGPVDIRDGVIIGPRTIPAERPQAVEPQPVAPSPAPPAAPSPAASPSPQATGSQGDTGESPTVAPPRAPGPDRSPARQPESGTAPTPSVESSSAPTLDPLPDEPDGTASTDQPGEPADAPTASDFTSPSAVGSAGVPSVEGSSTVWPWFAALLVLLGGLGWWFWRRRSGTPAAAGITAPSLADGVRRAIPGNSSTRDTAHSDAVSGASQQPHSLKPVPAPVAEPSPAVGSLDETPSPAKVALQVEIASASRSLMAFTVEYRLVIANRSDTALRDLGISARLVCARSGSAASNADTGQPLQLIERIGPHQSRGVGGEVQLPLSSVSPLRQGATPLLIPLLQVTLGSAGFPARTYNFVIGSPSATSATRLHPIPLDTPPGGVPGLRAREIKDAPQRQTA
ncbi:hypothetical protein [Erythrobacter sp. THAF29]|uniref:hypothetical protein n=1 Tax=Erythrobacter sp. THAF29 TaxID=2587851 RepID=UPI0012682A2A|nr:hypothetical protein [Erythrobacter sp. THAF29]